MERLSPKPIFENHKEVPEWVVHKQVEKAARASLSFTKTLVRGRVSHGISCNKPSSTLAMTSNRILSGEVT